MQRYNCICALLRSPHFWVVWWPLPMTASFLFSYYLQFISDMSQCHILLTQLSVIVVNRSFNHCITDNNKSHVTNNSNIIKITYCAAVLINTSKQLKWKKEEKKICPLPNSRHQERSRKNSELTAKLISYIIGQKRKSVILIGIERGSLCYNWLLTILPAIKNACSERTEAFRDTRHCM